MTLNACGEKPSRPAALRRQRGATGADGVVLVPARHAPGGLLHIDWEELYGGSSGIDYQAIFSLPNQDVLSIGTQVPDG
jgi:hypothetical protein